MKNLTVNSKWNNFSAFEIREINGFRREKKVVDHAHVVRWLNAIAGYPKSELHQSIRTKKKCCCFSDEHEQIGKPLMILMTLAAGVCVCPTKPTSQQIVMETKKSSSQAYTVFNCGYFLIRHFICLIVK